MKPRTLVIGATGQVGRAVRRRFGDVVGTGSRELDLADPAAIHRVIDDVRPTRIVLCAAMTHVDRCEDEPLRAHAINAEGPRHVAEAAARIGARVVALGTEYVFAGHDGPYAEIAVPQPINEYGRTKLAGERAVLAVPGNAVVRTTVVYGWDPDGMNFVMQLRRRLSAGETMRVPADQVSTPTLADDLAEALFIVVRDGIDGIVHAVGPDRLDRATFARAAARAFGLDPERVEAVATAALGQRARRPLIAGLTNTLHPKLQLRGVDAGLAFVAAQA